MKPFHQFCIWALLIYWWIIIIIIIDWIKLLSVRWYSETNQKWTIYRFCLILGFGIWWNLLSSHPLFNGQLFKSQESLFTVNLIPIRPSPLIPKRLNVVYFTSFYGSITMAYFDMTTYGPCPVSFNTSSSTTWYTCSQYESSFVWINSCGHTTGFYPTETWLLDSFHRETQICHCNWFFPK